MRNGFSYVQILLIVAVISILGGVAAPYYVQFQTRQQLSEAVDRLVVDLRYAQTKAMQRAENNVWGVHIQDSTKEYVLFYGPGYTPSQSNNQTIGYANSVSVAPDQDIVFAPVTGLPNIPTTLTIQSSAIPDDIRTIEINAEGRIQVQ